jgi:hypothetical protein
MNGQGSEVRSARSAAFAELRRARKVKHQTSDRRRQRSAISYQPSLELRIEELVLHGFAPGSRYAIGDAVEGELARLLDERGIPASLRSENAIDEIRGATFNTRHTAKPPAIGREIAQAIYRGFG